MSGVTGVGQWERRRAQLSHDRIKNGAVPAISKFYRIAAGEVLEADYLFDFERVSLPVLQASLDQVEDLVNDAEVGASPRVFFHETPLNGCGAVTLGWLPDAIHENWMRRHRVRERVGRVKRSVEQVRELLEHLCHDLQQSDNAELIGAARMVQNSIHRLSEELSELAAIVPYRR